MFFKTFIKKTLQMFLHLWSALSPATRARETFTLISILS